MIALSDSTVSSLEQLSRTITSMSERDEPSRCSTQPRAVSERFLVHKRKLMAGAGDMA